MFLYNQQSCVGGGYEKTLEGERYVFHHIQSAVTEFYDSYHTNRSTKGGGTRFMNDKSAVLQK